MYNYKIKDGQSDSWNCRSASTYAKFPTTTYDVTPQSESDYLDKKTDTLIDQDVQDNFGSTVRAANDAISATATIHNPISLPNSILSSPDDGLPASVKSYLAKPVAHLQGLFALTDNPATFEVYPTSAPMRLNKSYYEKLSGVMSIRYTTVVTLQVNANRFQQGRYILAFLPTGGALWDPSDVVATNAWIRMHRGSAVEITQLHHVELDLNSDTSVQLRIPYVSAYPALNWYQDLAKPYFGDPGVFFLYPYSPLSAPVGNVTASYTLWVNYEDIEVFGNTIPTSAAVAEAQMQRVKKNKKKNVDLFAQEESVSTGPISSGLRLISEGMDHFSKVPLLSSVASPTSWVLRAASSLASSVGWSKPPITDKITRVNRFPHPFIANEDQADDCQPLGVFSDNHVSVAPGFSSTDIDELSINYLKSIFSYFHSFYWDTTQVAGTSLVSFYMDPSLFFVLNITDTTVHHETPVAYLANKFARYSGGFIIKIKVVKTEFHSGRLLAAFNPFESAATAGTIAYDNTSYLHKTVLDIREQSEFIIEIPYVSIIPWRNTQSPNAIFGELRFFVLDELVAPETVEGTIELLVEVAGAPDLQFSVPNVERTTAYAPATMQMAFGNNADTSNNPSVNDVAMVGGTVAGEVSLDKAELCVGEVVTSLRSLLKRGGFLGMTTVASATTQNVKLNPYAWRYFTLGDTPTEYTYDIYSSLSSMYALQRGGIRIRQATTSAAGLVQVRMDNHNETTTNSTAVVNITNTSSSDFIEATANAQYAVGLQQLGGIGVSVPFYHYTHSTCSVGNSIGTLAPLNYDISRGGNQVSLNIQYSPAINYRATPYYRAGADDCNFGVFVSTVPQKPIAVIVP